MSYSNVFLSRLSKSLPNWTAAFPHALTANNIDSIKPGYNGNIWIHADPNNVDWVKKNLDRVRKLFPLAKIVVLANVPNNLDAQVAISLGASAYCHAYTDVDVLLEVRMVIEHGGLWLGKEILSMLIKGSAAMPKDDEAKKEDAIASLSEREREVAREVSLGRNNKDIARKMDITERTVKAHITAILRKLGAKDRLQLALIVR